MTAYENIQAEIASRTEGYILTSADHKALAIEWEAAHADAPDEDKARVAMWRKMGYAFGPTAKAIGIYVTDLKKWLAENKLHIHRTRFAAVTVAGGEYVDSHDWQVCGDGKGGDWQTWFQLSNGWRVMLSKKHVTTAHFGDGKYGHADRLYTCFVAERKHRDAQAEAEAVAAHISKPSTFDPFTRNNMSTYRG